MKPITYLSDQSADYCEGLAKCDTLEKLQEFVSAYHTIFPDALDALPQNETEFKTFLTGLKKERRGKFAGEAFAERYGAVMMPEIAFRVSMVASQFHAPWGCAFIRLSQEGYITHDDRGICQWEEKTNAKSH